MTRDLRRAATALGVIVGLGVLVSVLERTAWAAATIIVDDNDGAGVGLNDPTPFAPTGGNTATSLGQARLLAFQFAASSWGKVLVSTVPIHIAASFEALACDTSSAQLGSAAATTVHRDFPSAPVASTWYPQALANAIAGVDLDPSSADVTADFSSALDGGGCLGGTRWYYGLDGHPAASQIDFATVVLHELAHGLGFQTFVDLASGAKLMGDDDVFMRNLEQHGASPPGYPAMTDAQRVAASTSEPNLLWTGSVVDAAAPTILSAGTLDGEVRLYGPLPQVPGSSVSHFSMALTPNQLMEPFYAGANHDLALTLDSLRDLGWNPPHATVVPALSFRPASALALALAAVALTALGPRRPRRRERPKS